MYICIVNFVIHILLWTQLMTTWPRIYHVAMATRRLLKSSWKYFTRAVAFSPIRNPRSRLGLLFLLALTVCRPLKRFSQNGFPNVVFPFLSATQITTVVYFSIRTKLLLVYPAGPRGVTALLGDQNRRRDNDNYLLYFIIYSVFR